MVFPGSNHRHRLQHAQGFDFLEKVIQEMPDSNCRDRIRRLREESTSSLTDLGLRFGTGGYVGDSVPMALLAASRAGALGFQESLLSLIACGGDTDTTAAMAGQVAGSKLGLSGIPRELRTLPLGPEPVFDIATRFADLICK